MRAIEKAKMNKRADPPPMLKDVANEADEDKLTPADVRTMLEGHFIDLWGT